MGLEGSGSPWGVSSESGPKSHMPEPDRFMSEENLEENREKRPTLPPKGLEHRGPEHPRSDVGGEDMTFFEMAKQEATSNKCIASFVTSALL